MTATEILTPVILGLAFFGYVQCLVRRPWVTLALSLGFAAVVSRVFPLVPENTLAWLGVTFVALVAVIAARLWPLHEHAKAEAPKKRLAKTEKAVVIDGTNVIYWDSNEPALTTLCGVVDHLKAREYLPYVFLDASSRHHLKDDSLTEKGFAKAFGLHHSRVMVCPAGIEADVFILKFARSEGLPIVSNDRFGDRAQQVKGIKLVKGVVANGKVMLEGLSQ